MTITPSQSTIYFPNPGTCSRKNCTCGHAWRPSCRRPTMMIRCSNFWKIPRPANVKFYCHRPRWCGNERFCCVPKPRQLGGLGFQNVQEVLRYYSAGSFITKALLKRFVLSIMFAWLIIEESTMHACMQHACMHASFRLSISITSTVGLVVAQKVGGLPTN